jgi:Zn-dependent protease with chaperone function
MTAVRLISLLFVSLLLGGCASTGTDSGRSRFVAPRQLGEAYSQVELRTMLALTPDAQCQNKACDVQLGFRREVVQLGSRLAKAAREIKTELRGPQPNFIFLVPAKDEIGTLSSASGNIVLFDGLRQLELEEPALAFLIAREMGHVISQHHEENSATSIGVSLAFAIVMPMAAVLRGAAATVSALTTTSAVGTAATTAASIAGTHIIKSIYRPDQLHEADTIALKIMHQAGWSAIEIADALQTSQGKLENEGWEAELLVSKVRLENIFAGPVLLPPTSIAEATTIDPQHAVD